jgi:hypothetical protein
MFDFEEWAALSSGDPFASLPDVSPANLPTASVSVSTSNDQSQELTVESGDASPSSSPWFLRDETWALEHNDHTTITSTISMEMAPFISAVEDMLQCWVKNGYNSFIHRRLYDKGMPTCVQDAYTTFAAYMGRTATMKDTILKIAEDRTAVLVAQSPPASSGMRGILEHLSRVHALFVYEFIGLFDGAVRPRVAAEKQITTLRRWVVEMWDAAKQYRGEHVSNSTRPLQWAGSDFDREYDASSKMWQSWILAESVRRTQLIVDTTLNTYHFMTEGWSQCTGAGMITLRRGLWDAENAVKWMDLCCKAPPLLVPSLQPEPLISWHEADEFDDLARILWSYLVGADKMEFWVNKSKHKVYT